MHHPSAYRRASALALAIALAGAPQLAGASVIDCGPTVCFQFDETQAGIAAFGSPVRVGDSMQFLPPSQLALSASGAGPVSLSFSFVFERIFSFDGGDILEFHAFEEGDYEIIGGGTVTASLQLTAQSNLGPDQTLGSSLLNATGDSAGGQLWSTSTSVAPALDFQGPASDISLTITNLLQANTSGFGDLAWIQKKFVLTAGDIEPATPVPLPGSLALLATGLGCCGLRVGRKRRARNALATQAGDTPAWLFSL